MKQYKYNKYLDNLLHVCSHRIITISNAMRYVHKTEGTRRRIILYFIYKVVVCDTYIAIIVNGFLKVILRL